MFLSDQRESGDVSKCMNRRATYDLQCSGRAHEVEAPLVIVPCGKSIVRMFMFMFMFMSCKTCKQLQCVIACFGNQNRSKNKCFLSAFWILRSITSGPVEEWGTAPSPITRHGNCFSHVGHVLREQSNARTLSVAVAEGCVCP